MTPIGREDRARPRFRPVGEPATTSIDPEAMFGELPRTPTGVGALWSHQADQLRTYSNDHRETPDVALELPTGSGKTLVGLLICEWRRRTLQQRVVYACPTKQLARQVLAKAKAQGIEATLLIGSNRCWDQAELGRYTRGEAIAITTYSAIFNLNSHLADAQTLMFDDAHAAEGYVAEAWALTVDCKLDQYQQFLDALADWIEPTFVARMVAPASPAADASEVRLLPIGAIARHAADIDRVLATLENDPSYRFRMLRESLSSCLFYVSRREIYIRPMIPPTFQHHPFTTPTQRIYLSATLGDAGELERAFGRTGIKRVPVPEAWDRTGSGRRFFVFPQLASSSQRIATKENRNSLMEASDDDAKPDAGLAGELLNLAKKRLILTPDSESAKAMADLFDVPEEDRYTAKDAESGIEPFIEAVNGTLIAPNRYDGMDLADDACRMMMMSELPTASHLQDRFLGTKLRAVEILQERIRTRVLQGVGRCTRGPKDWAVVVVIGEDILRFLSRTEVRKSLPVELQAEITFGLEQSQVGADDLVYLAESALHQDEIWQQDAEPELVKLRRAAKRESQPHAAELSASTAREVKAWTHAWQQEWDAAASAAVEVFEHLTSPGVRPYRALWAYFGSAWSALASADPSSAASERSFRLLREAHRDATGTSWLKEIQPLPSAAHDIEPVDQEGVDGVLTLFQGPLRSATRFERQSSIMLANLHQRGATQYEQGLVELGKLLGAESFKPSGQGRADAVWIWPSLWMTVEAKSEQTAEGMLSMDYVRQANSQLASVAADREVERPPEASISVIVTPRSVVDPDAVPIAGGHLFRSMPKQLQDVAHDVIRACTELRSVGTGVSREILHIECARIFWEHRVLPTQVAERLSADPIRGV
ncbi:DEAD/DEAH box helicase family protein [Arthrobacter sp.]|uniref:DEAD/DEAH box helicase family protein n=1 Tax=Arthrobacter sp. TaxID=1667 RepID=UPI003A924E4F